MTAVGSERLPLRWTTAAVAAVLLLMHFALAVGSKRHESTTSDEIAHLTAGFAYWRFDDYRLQPENGVLPQRWEALPAYIERAKFPTLDQVYWRTSEVWVLGHEFFYETGEDHFPRLMAGRAMAALFSVGTGLLIFAWSRTLFGDAAGLFSLTLFTFCPNFLAHGALATSDVCMVFFFVASLGAWWRHLHDPRARWAVISALTFGLACVAKFSAVLLLPMMVLIAAPRFFSPRPLEFGARSFASSRGKLVALAASAAFHGAVAMFVIWAFYGFRYSAFNPALPPASQFIRRWDLIYANMGFQAPVVRTLASLHVLPEAFLYGYSYVIDSAQTRAAYLNGAFSMVGWHTFFPWAFLLKTPLPLLITCGALLATVGRRWAQVRSRVRRDLYRVWPLLVLLVVYGAFSLATHLNIGHRHILPLYPVLFIGAGALVASIRSCRRAMAASLALVVLAGWQVAEAARIAPHFLAYFNELGGGPSEGYRHLVDSSLDWGQDLPGLKTWLDHNVPAGTPVYLSYFGTGEPDYYGIRARRLNFLNGFKIPSAFVALEPGVYAISATCLEQVYSPMRGPWTLERERAYQELRQMVPAFLDYEQHPEHRAAWRKTIPADDWARSRERFEDLRFARLCAYLRARQPDAQIGYSINIYRVTATELAAATGGDLTAWRTAIEQAVDR